MTLFTEKLLNYGQSKYDRPVTNNEIELLITKTIVGNNFMDGKRKLAIKNNCTKYYFSLFSLICLKKLLTFSKVTNVIIVAGTTLMRLGLRPL